MFSDKRLNFLCLHPCSLNASAANYLVDSDISVYETLCTSRDHVDSLTPEGQVPFISVILGPHKSLGMTELTKWICPESCVGCSTPVLMHTSCGIFFIWSTPAAATLHFCDPGA